MVRAYLTVAIAIWSASLTCGQEKRKTGWGVYLRQGFSSSGQRVSSSSNYHGHSTEMMRPGVGFFLIIPIPKDSIGIPPRQGPKVWKTHHVKVEAGLTQQSAIFFLVPNEPFRITSSIIDVSLIAPLYFKASGSVHGYLGAGVYGSYYARVWVTTDGTIAAPNVILPDLSIGTVLDFGLLIGKPDKPAMIISSRFYDQLSGTYRFREFAITISVAMWRKYRG